MPQFTKERQDTYIEALKLGHRRTIAMEMAGISHQTLAKRRNNDEAFAEREIQAEERSVELVEEALFNQAINGNVTAIQVFLYNRAPSRWRDQRGRAIAEQLEQQRETAAKLHQDGEASASDVEAVLTKGLENVESIFGRNGKKQAQ